MNELEKIQRRVKQDAEELSAFLKDLNKWEKEIEQHDKSISEKSKKEKIIPARVDNEYMIDD